MQQLIIINGSAFLIAALYSYIVNKFSKSRILLFLPSILGVLLFLANLISDSINPPEGLAGLAIVIVGMLVVSVLLGNLLFGLALIYKDKKDRLN